MRIGVFCSGGDAPGMNACIRAVVRAGLNHGHEIVGIRRGYQGLLDNDLYRNAVGDTQMTLRCVSDWARYGGTFLRSSRCDEFRTAAGLEKAADILRRRGIQALIAIGGDGTFHGAVELADYWDGQIVGCPGTIDNDLIGTDYTIGFATAVQTAVDAVDKIRDTAESHERMFLIEVMGRHNGYIAVHTALASAAEAVFIPETANDFAGLLERLRSFKGLGKSSVMCVVAEGDEEGGANVLHQRLQEAACPFSTRVVVLGHLQRGGTPVSEDRILASQLGAWAVAGLDDGQNAVMVGRCNGQPVFTPFPETYAQHRPIPAELLQLLDLLAS